MIDGVNDWLKIHRSEVLMAEKDNLTQERIQEILTYRIRREKILVKDAKMRTFITNDTDREDIVGHAYDVTYGIIEPNQDTLVIIDDSIVDDEGVSVEYHWNKLKKDYQKIEPDELTSESSSDIPIQIE